MGIGTSKRLLKTRDRSCLVMWVGEGFGAGPPANRASKRNGSRTIRFELSGSVSISLGIDICRSLD